MNGSGKTNLNISLVGGGGSAKSNAISGSVNNKTKGGGPGHNSPAFTNFNIPTCRHGVGHLNTFVLTTEHILGGMCTICCWYLVDNQHENKSKDKADTDDVWDRVLLMMISVSRLFSAFTMMAGGMFFNAGKVLLEKSH